MAKKHRGQLIEEQTDESAAEFAKWAKNDPVINAGLKVANAEHARRIAVSHNHAALIDHLRLMREHVTLVPGADSKSYPDGWKAAIDEVMKNIPMP